MHLLARFGVVHPGLSFWSASLAEALLASIWAGLLLTLGTGTALRLLPDLSAARRSWIWLGVLLVALALPLVPLTFASAPLTHIHSDPATSTGSHWTLILSQRWSAALVLISLCLSAWRVMALGASALRLRAIARSAQPVVPPPAVERMLQTARRPALLCESMDVSRPSVAGFGDPRVLLPAGWLERLSEAELEQIVLHELAHLARRDDWTNLLQKLALAAFPLNPVLFWLDRRLSLERELACDDAVLRRTNARKAYAACLVTLAEHSTLLGRGVSLALGAWERQGELARRVQRILAQPARVMSPGWARATVAAITAGLATAAVLLTQMPSPVRFASATPLTSQSALRAGVESSLRRPEQQEQIAMTSKPVQNAGRDRMAGTVHAHPVSAVAETLSVALPTASTTVEAASGPHPVLASQSLDHPFPAVVPAITSTGRRSLAGTRPVTPQQRTALLAAWNRAEQRHITRRIAAQRELLQWLDTQSEPAAHSLGFQPTFAAVPTPDGWLIVQL